ncbi:MAG: type II toxin-antitoxin system RelE/ParE family toxin [Betaproteobacteria bacterium]|nr:type II toxin-antitoxin system RelE/ParE family toxin [Betaproteobacteria bacterium]
MIFVESPQFTRAITELMDDDEYRLLQAALLANPEAGAVIVGSGGLRKIRWSLPGRGKRGGARMIYYYWVVRRRIYLLFAYSKSAKGDLTREQTRILAGLMQREVRDG